MGRIVDGFAGPGGWDEALAELGRSADVLGIELDDAACATRAAAGHRTLQADFSTVDHLQFTGLEGFIASPPCQGFSSAGKGAARDLIPELLESIHARRWSDRADPDPRVWLIVDLGRWLEQLDPEWIALEQVPAVLPIWRAYAEMLRERGYSTWTGILNAADYGVPQTRTRAILMAHRTRTVHPPAATHDRDPVDSLFGTLERWVTMADALPEMADRFESWQVGFPRLDDRGDSPDGYRERDWRDADEPAFVVTEKARSWVIRTGNNSDQGRGQVIDYERSVDEPSPTIRQQSKSWTVNTGRDWVKGGAREDAQTIDAEAAPAPALTAKAGGQWMLTRPATTIQGDARCWPPGHKVNQGDRDRLGEDEANERYGDRAGTEAIRLEVIDALVLQSFRPDYPVAGTKTKAFEQIGNAIPPLLARHILAALL